MKSSKSDEAGGVHFTIQSASLFADYLADSRHWKGRTKGEFIARTRSHSLKFNRFRLILLILLGEISDWLCTPTLFIPAVWHCPRFEFCSCQMAILRLSATLSDIQQPPFFLVSRPRYGMAEPLARQATGSMHGAYRQK